MSCWMWLRLRLKHVWGRATSPQCILLVHKGKTFAKMRRIENDEEGLWHRLQVVPTYSNYVITVSVVGVAFEMNKNIQSCVSNYFFMACAMFGLFSWISLRPEDILCAGVCVWCGAVYASTVRRKMCALDVTTIPLPPPPYNVYVLVRVWRLASKPTA